MPENHDVDTAVLVGQVALVTGGGRGIGRAIAHVLAKAGARVAVVARSADQVTETVAQITASGGQALAVTADVSDRQAVAAAVRTVEQQLGAVDLLINNAGISSPLGPLWEVDPDEWWRSMEINIRSIVLCSAAVLPTMIARRQGRIINVASGMGTVSTPNFSAYITSKTAVIRLSEVLASETKPYDIQVFAIDPGLVHTRHSAEFYGSAVGRREGTSGWGRPGRRGRAAAGWPRSGGGALGVGRWGATGKSTPTGVVGGGLTTTCSRHVLFSTLDSRRESSLTRGWLK